MSPQEAIAAHRAARQSWVELEPAKDGQPAKRVQIIRPRDAEAFDLRDLRGGGEIDLLVRCACKYVTGWDGFTLADLLGAAIAPPDPAPFSAELWAEVAPDHSPWLVAVFEALNRAVEAELQRREAAAKN